MAEEPSSKRIFVSTLVSSDELRLGQIIYFRTYRFSTDPQAPEPLLYCQGIGDTQVRVMMELEERNTISFSQCLFRVDACGYERTSSIENRMEMNSRTKGTVVCYGDAIQLFHLQSEMFLSFSVESRFESGHLKVEVTNKPAERSWFSLVSTDYTYALGQPVRFSHAIRLSAVVEMVDHFLGISPDKEVFASDRPNNWTVSKVVDWDVGEHEVICLVPLCIVHKQFGLKLATRETSCVKEKKSPIDSPVMLPSHRKRKSSWIYIPQEAISKETAIISSFEADASCYWRLEATGQGGSGRIECSKSYFLRNIRSGKYLSRTLELVYQPSDEDRFQLRPRHTRLEFLLDLTDVEVITTDGKVLVVNPKYSKTFHDYGIIPVFSKEEMALSPKSAELEVVPKTKVATLSAFEVSIIPRNIGLSLLQACSATVRLNTFVRFLDTWDLQDINEEMIVALQTYCDDLLRIVKDVVEIVEASSGERRIMMQETMIGVDIHVVSLRLIRWYRKFGECQFRPSATHTRDHTQKAISLMRKGEVVDTKQLFRDIGYPLFCEIIKLLTLVADGNRVTSTKISELYEEICEVLSLNVKAVGELLIGLFQLVDPKISNYAEFFSQWISRLETLTEENAEEQAIWLRLLRYLTQERDGVNRHSQAEVASHLLIGPDALQLIRIGVERGLYFVEFVEISDTPGSRMDLLDLSELRMQYVFQTLMLFSTLCCEGNEEAVAHIESLGLTANVLLTWMQDSSLPLILREACISLSNTTLIARSSLTSLKTQISHRVYRLDELEGDLDCYLNGSEGGSAQLKACRSWVFQLWCTYDGGKSFKSHSQMSVLKFTCAAVKQLEELLDHGGPTKLFTETMKMALILLLVSLNKNQASEQGSHHWSVVLKNINNEAAKQHLTQLTIHALQFISEIELHFKLCELICIFRKQQEANFASEAVEKQCSRVVTNSVESTVKSAVKRKIAIEMAKPSRGETERGLLSPDGSVPSAKVMFSLSEYLKLLTELLFTASDFTAECINSLFLLLGESLNIGEALSTRLYSVALIVDPEEAEKQSRIKDLIDRLELFDRMAVSVDDIDQSELRDVLMSLLRLVQVRRHDTIQSLHKTQDLLRNMGLPQLLASLWKALCFSSEFSDSVNLLIPVLFHVTFSNELNQEMLRPLIEGHHLDVYSPLCPWLLQQVKSLMFLTQTQRSALISSVLKQCVHPKDTSRLSGLTWIRCVIGSGQAYNHETQIIAANRIIGCIQSLGLAATEEEDQPFLARLVYLLSQCCVQNEFVASQCRSYMSFNVIQGLLTAMENEAMLLALWEFYDKAYIQDTTDSDFMLPLASIDKFLQQFTKRQRDAGYAELLSMAEQGRYELVYSVDSPELLDTSVLVEIPNVAEGWKVLASGDFWETPGGATHLLETWLRGTRVKAEAAPYVRSIQACIESLRSDLAIVALSQTDIKFDALMNRLQLVLESCKKWIELLPADSGDVIIVARPKPLFSMLMMRQPTQAEMKFCNFRIPINTVDTLLKFQQFQMHFGTKYVTKFHRTENLSSFVNIISSIEPFNKLKNPAIEERDLEKMTAIIAKLLRDMKSSQLASLFKVFNKLFEHEAERRAAISVAFDSRLLLEAVMAVTSTNFSLAKSALKFLNGFLNRQTGEFQDRFLQMLITKELYFAIFLLLRDQLKTSLENVSDLGKKQFNSIFAPLLTHFDKKNYLKMYTKSGADKMKTKQIKFCQQLVRFTKLCCDNCHKQFQEFLNNQQTQLQDELSAERVSLNVVNTIAVYVIQISGCSKAFVNSGTHIIGICLDALADYVTGPCTLNQLSLGSNLQFILALNRLYNDAKNLPSSENWVFVCEMVVSLLLTLVEGCPDQLILKTILTYANLPMFYDHMKTIYEKYIRNCRDFLLFGRMPPTPSPDIPFNTLPRLVSLGFSIFRLLTRLKNLAPGLDMVLQSPQDTKSMVSIWDRLKLGKITSLVSFSQGYLEFYESFTAYVEIAREDKIEVHYFQIPWKCKFLTDKTREQIIMEVSRDSYHEKIEDFLKFSALCSVEMDHQLHLYNHSGLKAFSRGWKIYGLVSYILILAINLALLIVVDDPNILSLSATSQSAVAAITVIGCFQVVFALLGHIAYVLEYYPNLVFSGTVNRFTLDFSDYSHIDHNDSLLMRRVNEDLDFIIPVKGSRFLHFSYIFLNWESLYFILFLTASAVALWNPFWYCFLLLDAVKRSDAVNNILMSITLNWKQLIITSIFGLFIVFIFATIGFTYFNEYYGEEGGQFITYCTTLYECFFSTLDLGIRMGGGIGDAIKSPKIGEEYYWSRVAFDLLFFVLVIIIILNVIFGIIIDTFAELRDRRQALDHDMSNNCYICGKARSTLELHGQGWTKHFLVEHSPLAYLAFIIYLEEKEITECSGIEKFVKEKLIANDASFMPTTSKYLQDHEHDN